MKRVFPALFALFLASCAEQGGGASAPKPAPTSAPAREPAWQQDREDTGRSVGVPDAKPAPVAKRRSNAPVASAPRMPSSNNGEERIRERRQRLKERRTADSHLEASPARSEGTTEFGGRVFLSNDDSMSLASAQRVLWSVAQGKRVAASELRPHELLNYFTFEKPKLARGATFGVDASAVRTEAGLALALAITGAVPERRPLDLTVLVDRSASMDDEGRIAFVKRGLLTMLDRLRAGDRVDVVLFNDEVHVARSGFVVGKDDLDDLRVLFEEIRPDDSTDLNKGLKAAYALAREHAKNPGARGRDARVLVVTDAVLTSGDVHADRATEIARAFDESGIRLAAIGVGSDFNDDVLQRLTEKGRGGYVYLGSEKVVDRVFGNGFDSLVRIVADDVRFALDLPDSLGMSRFYGEEMSTAAADVVPVSFHAGTTQLFLQDLKVAPSGLVKSDPLVLDLTWRDPLTGKERTQRWEKAVGDVLAADRANVTKARALMAWTDLVRAGSRGCQAEKREWASRARTFGGDVETRYLDGLVADWCPEPERANVIAEAE